MLRRRHLVSVPSDLTTVTDIARDREVDPAEVGLPAAAPERIWRAVERLYRTGTQPAIALCVRRDGKVLLDRAIGHQRGNAPHDPPEAAKVPVRTTTPFCLFSASKAITAMVIHHLDDRGLLHVGDRVVEYLPEFGKHGKDWVTLEHVLSHRAGIPAMGDESDLHLLATPGALVQRLCDTKPVPFPRRRLAYHAVTGGFVLGEIVRRVTGRSVDDVLGELVREPLGFSGLTYGWPTDRLHEVASCAFTGPEPGPLIDRIARRAIGTSLQRAAEIGNDPLWLGNEVPSGNLVATADEACRFFDLLLHGGELDGHRVFEARTIRRATTETSWLELDLTLMLPVRYGVGFQLGGEVASLFGPGTPKAFGHLGFTNVLAWCDPERRTSAALLTSGKSGVSTHLAAFGAFLASMSWNLPKVA